MAIYINMYQQYFRKEEEAEDVIKHGFTQEQSEIIKNSVDHLLFTEVIKEFMQIVEAVCPGEKQVEAIRKIALEGLRRRQGQFNALLKNWVKEPQSIVSIERATTGTTSDVDSLAKEIMKQVNR